MYDLPSQGNVKRVVLDENAIEGEGKPLLIYADENAAPEKPERGEVRDAAA
jgi:ATP-dependent Clp protease ATP-binding subunit ClpX